MAIQVDPSTSALLIQDLQNDVISGGVRRLRRARACQEPEGRLQKKVVSKVKKLARAARAAKMPVIHVGYLVEKGAPGLKQNAPLFQGVKEGKGLVRGTWGGEPSRGSKPSGAISSSRDADERLPRHAARDAAQRARR